MNDAHTHEGYAPHEHDGAIPGHTHDDATTTAAPAAAPAAAPVATTPAAVEVGPSGGGVATRMILTILGAAGMIFGAFLPLAFDLAGTETPFRLLFSTEGGDAAGIASSAGAVLIVLGLLALVGLAFRTGWLTRLAGALGLVTLVLLVITMMRGDFGDIGTFQIGFWISALGSLLALIGGFFGSRPRVVATSVPAY
jgi:hypothetical protein